MIEELFDLTEIQQILLEAKHPDYSNPDLLHLGSKKTSIQGVSNNSDLILVYGNDSTGLKHIIERHSLTSRKPYWSDEGKIGNPSKFPLGLSVQKYLEIASKIFNSTNKNEEKNSRPDVFDVYVGRHRLKNEAAIELTLVTYKDTGIIHSFYVSDNKKPFNKKKIVNLRQGWSSGSHELMNCIQTIKIPYFDTNNVKRFKIIIRHFEIKKVERWYIQVNSSHGDPVLTTFIKEQKREERVDIAIRIVQIDFSTITWVEKIIKQIMEDKYDF